MYWHSRQHMKDICCLLSSEHAVIKILINWNDPLIQHPPFPSAFCWIQIARGNVSPRSMCGSCLLVLHIKWMNINSPIYLCSFFRSSAPHTSTTTDFILQNKIFRDFLPQWFYFVGALRGSVLRLYNKLYPWQQRRNILFTWLCPWTWSFPLQKKTSTKECVCVFCRCMHLHVHVVFLFLSPFIFLFMLIQ